MNPTIFTVTSQHLAALSASRAVTLIANLLWAEARKIGLPTTRVNISMRIYVADGGVDASVDLSELSDPKATFIPSDQTAFQIKTGDSFVPWREGDIKNELFGNAIPAQDALGDSLRACLDTRGTYIIVCTGTDPNEQQVLIAKKHLQSYFEQCGYDNANVDLWGQNKLIGLLQAFPSLALEVNGSSSEHFLSHPAWSKEIEMLRPFRPGDKQQTFIKSLQDALRSNDRPVHVHVRGEAGIGKTRLVLEASSAHDVSPLVLYCDKPSVVIEGNLLRQLTREDSQPSAILVVDECDLERRVQIWNRLQFQSPRIKLISIYNDVVEPTGTTSVLDAPPLEDAQVIEIFEGYGIPQHEAQRWAHYCDGSPRAAHVIGQNLKNNPEDILRDPDTVNFWDRYVAGGDALNSQDVQQRRTTLQFIALYKRFGYGPPVTNEARKIAAQVGRANPQITWHRFQEIVKLLRRRKVLQGETTLYITPKVLHIKLWSEWWDTYGDGLDPSTFAEEMLGEGGPGQLARWFREMFQYAAESRAALRITNELLDENSRFGHISFFENRHGAGFFMALTNAAPGAALRYLERTVGTWDSQRLAKFISGRREVVWSLERIAVWRPLFRRAAALLLRLAEVENENFANNSTGVFADLFSAGHGPLAPTEASPGERFPILEEAVQSPSKKRREIALKACDHALEATHFSRMVGAEYQGLRRPPQLWMPSTWGEVFDAYRRVWHLILANLPKFDTEEFHQALKVLTTNARGLSRFANLSDMLVDSMSNLAEAYPHGRIKIIEAVESIVHYEKKTLLPENLQRWEALRDKLTGTDFHSQMERYVGMELLEDSFDEDGKLVDKTSRKIQALAREAFGERGLLARELPWLVTDKAKNAYRFGYELAVVDERFDLLEQLLHAQRTGTVGTFVGGYFSVLFERNPPLWEKTLDECAEEPQLRTYVPELTWRSGMTERAALRVLNMAEAKMIPVASFRMFAFGGVVHKIPSHVFELWVDRMLRDENRLSTWAALDLFHFYYTIRRKQLPRELTLRLLTAPALFTKSERVGLQGEDWDWGQVAKAFLDQYPAAVPEVADCLLRSFGEEGSITDSYRSEPTAVLTIIAEKLPSATWQLITKYVGPPVDTSAFHISRWLRDGGLTFMPASEVWNWIDNDVATRASYAASFVPPVLHHAPDSVCWAREILIRYGHLKEVRNALYANFSTGSWWGPESAHHQTMKHTLEEFRNGETDPAVIQWLDDFIATLESSIDNARVREEREF